MLKQIFGKKKEKPMGGDNQSVLGKDKKVESVLPADDMETLDMAEAKQKDKRRKSDKSKKKPKKPKPSKNDKAQTQTQNLRQHKSDKAPEFHWHDDENGLKAAIPVADWFAMSRRIEKMEVVEYTDVKNNTYITFTPYISEGVVDVVTRLESVVVSARMSQLLSLAGK